MDIFVFLLDGTIYQFEAENGSDTSCLKELLCKIYPNYSNRICHFTKVEDNDDPWTSKKFPILLVHGDKFRLLMTYPIRIKFEKIEETNAIEYEDRMGIRTHGSLYGCYLTFSNEKHYFTFMHDNVDTNFVSYTKNFYQEKYWHITEKRSAKWFPTVKELALSLYPTLNEYPEVADQLDAKWKIVLDNDVPNTFLESLGITVFDEISRYYREDC